jgi:ElaB/YqjD/DUF883 family membrane-anchored ribosome-binding protein
MATPGSRTQAGRRQSERRQIQETECGDNELRAKVGDVARAAGEAAREQMQNLKAAASQYVEQGRERATDYVEHGRELASHYLEEGRQRAIGLERSLEQQIREQPLRAMLTAAGIGFVLGILFSRR